MRKIMIIFVIVIELWIIPNKIIANEEVLANSTKEYFNLK